MITAKDIKPKLGETAGVRAAFVLRFSFSTLRQVKLHAR
jgi:hypothetical protein